mmetsp:Transcript_1582/g.2845  ORF Transcript_1582/g.2845 Transcript_1582/m.2845 type:complete len:87 (-) Transcript_1582:88-348(-)
MRMRQSEGHNIDIHECLPSLEVLVQVLYQQERSECLLIGMPGTSLSTVLSRGKGAQQQQRFERSRPSLRLLQRPRSLSFIRVVKYE